jgi:hypothetical protein
MFRFTIREVVLLTLVVAMSVGWVLRERQLQNRGNRLHEKVTWLETAIDRSGLLFIFDQSGPRLVEPALPVENPSPDEN